MSANTYNHTKLLDRTYVGAYLPACRNNHTGVRSTFSPLAARTKRSFCKGNFSFAALRRRPQVRCCPCWGERTYLGEELKMKASTQQTTRNTESTAVQAPCKALMVGRVMKQQPSGYIIGARTCHTPPLRPLRDDPPLSPPIHAYICIHTCMTPDRVWRKRS